jgi:hypothetical protein
MQINVRIMDISLRFFIFNGSFPLFGIWRRQVVETLKPRASVEYLTEKDYVPPKLKIFTGTLASTVALEIRQSFRATARIGFG